MWLASVVTLVVLGGCSSASDQTIEKPPSPTSAAPVPAQGRSIVLRPGGIDALSFGAPADQVVAAMTAVLGAPKGDRTSAECDSGADRTVEWPSLFAVFSDGKWVGYLWEGGDSAPPAATEKGIGLGSTVAQLKAAYPGVSVEQTTLGYEWFVEITDTTSIGGFVAGSAATDKVERIYSGDFCAFR